MVSRVDLGLFACLINVWNNFGLWSIIRFGKGIGWQGIIVKNDEGT